MVQHDFSAPKRTAAAAASAASPTAALDQFLDYQNQSYFEQLYKSEAVCLCILRLLPPVVRHVVLFTLWSHRPLLSTDVKALCQMPLHCPISAVEEVLKPAMHRKVFGPFTAHKNTMRSSMNESFKLGLRNALTGLGKSNSFGVPYDRQSGDPTPTDDELVDYGENTWESILKYMVSSGLSNAMSVARPRNSVLQLLFTSGLMADITDPTGERASLDRLTITSKGFQFLLEDRQTQLWQILMYYLASKESRNEGSAEVLSLFFSLGCMQLGQDYSASESFPQAYQALDELEHYGFIYKRERTPDGCRADQFYPTHLATSLTSGSASVQSQTESGDEKKFLILETNYKIYAYTANELEIAILNLFVNIKVRYQNLVVGKLDRQHVKAAMEKGISANQIISYLQSHAHPQMYNSPPPLLHPTITDQLHLWDKERNRLQTDEVVMFEFMSKELFEETMEEAKRYDGLLHSVRKDDTKFLFIDPNIKDAIREFLQDRQQQLRMQAENLIPGDIDSASFI